MHFVIYHVVGDQRRCETGSLSSVLCGMSEKGRERRERGEREEREREREREGSPPRRDAQFCVI